MKLLLTSISIFSLTLSFANTGETEVVNPYAKFGENQQILTLSNGRYQEFFDLDTIEVIGSAVFNTNSMRVIGFIEQDTIHKEFAYEPEIVSRWLSPDPLAQKFPEMSPYHFVKNNPVIYIDPDGQENVIYLTNLALFEPGLEKSDKAKIIKQLNEVAAQTNKGYAEKGLTLRVQVIDFAPDANQIDASDSFATIGTKQQLSEFNDNNAAHAVCKTDPCQFDVIGVDNMGPERSSIIGAFGGDAGDRIAIDIDQVNTGHQNYEALNHDSPEAYMAWLIQHGSGHNAGISHSDELTGFKHAEKSGEKHDLMTGGPGQSSMEDKGKSIRNKVGSHMKNLFYKKKFTSNPAKDNLTGKPVGE